MNQASVRFKIWLLVAALLMSLAVIPSWPQGYYLFLKIIVFGASVVGSLSLRNNKKMTTHFVVLMMMAVLFNPIIPIELSPLVWIPVYLGGAVYFLQLSKRIE